MKTFATLIIILSTLYIANSFKHIGSHQKAIYTNDLVEAIRIIARKVLYRRYQMIHLITAVHNETDGEYKDLKTKLLEVIHEHYMCRVDDNQKVNTIQYRLRQNSLFLIDDIKSFREIVHSITIERYRFNGNFLFVLINGYFDEVEEIYDTMWKKNIFNVYSIYIEDNGVALNTFLPFRNNAPCGDTTPRVITRFKNGKFENEKILFPQKLQNLYKCPVRLVTFEDREILARKYFANGSYELHGYRMDFMNILSQELNYTNSIKIMEGDQPWGVIYSNGTATGAFLEVLENKSDIAFCEYYLKTSRNQFFDSSTVFYSTPLIFVIPMGQKLTNLEKLLQPFNWFVWITLSSTLLIAVIIILIINLKFKSHKAFVYGSNVKHPIINMMLGILGNQQTVLPKRNFARFILMMFLILCLVMRSVYQGSLYQFLQSDGRRKEVQSIQEMIDNDFTFYMFESSLDLIQTQTEILSRTKTFKGENFIMKRPLDGSEKIASLEALSDVHVANTDPERDFKLKICKEPLMTMNLVIYFRKSFYLIDEINKKITVLISSGIIDYWLRRSLDDFREVKNNHPRKLNIDDLTGPFNLLIIGHLTSLIIFLIEIFIYKMTLKIQLIRPIY